MEENGYKQKKQSFWSTLPGMLTGCAAVIGAIGGLGALITTLVTLGFIEPPFTTSIETLGAKATVEVIERERDRQRQSATATAEAIALGQSRAKEAEHATATAEAIDRERERQKHSATATAEAVELGPSNGNTDIDIDELFKRLQEAQEAPSNQFPTSNASGYIQSVNMLHNQWVGFEQGMNIEVNYTLNNAIGSACLIAAYFFNAFGPLRDFDGAYADVYGNVTSFNQKLVSNNSTSEKLNLSIPYSQLHLNPGLHNLQFNVGIVCFNPFVFVQSGFYQFTVTQY